MNSTIGKQKNVRFLQFVLFWHLEDGCQRAIDVSAAVVSCELSNLVKRLFECFVVVLDTAFVREEVVEVSSVADYLKS